MIKFKFVSSIVNATEFSGRDGVDALAWAQEHADGTLTQVFNVAGDGSTFKVMMVDTEYDLLWVAEDKE